MQARFQELEIVPNPQFSHIPPPPPPTTTITTLHHYLLTSGLQPHSDKETINHCVQFHLKSLNLLSPDRNNKYTFIDKTLLFNKNISPILIG